MFRILTIIALLAFVTVQAQAQQTRVDSLRYWTAPDYSRLVFDISAPATHEVFLLQNPARLVIDLSHAKLLKSLQQPPANHPFFTRVRSAARHKNDLRIVVDLKESVAPKSFLLKPSHNYGHRLVVDLFPGSSQTPVVHTTPIPTTALKTANTQLRDIIVAIDAGHGGEDPGAIGAKGSKEKDVVFQIAKKLAALINRNQGMQAVLVRKGDYFIHLRERMKIARAAKADLFVSIHADAFYNRSVKGASVFTLSNKGASSEAVRWLENHENAADLVGGVHLADKEDVLASVLIDLSQTATKEASSQIASKVLNNFKKIGHLHKDNVQKARFVVLKSPDIPSILIETAFISNPAEEVKLKSATHQTKMANAIFKGIDSYFKENSPPNTYYAQNSIKKHIISSGETLSGIAERYGVSIQAIQSVNALTNHNEIKVGDVLHIPRG